MPSDASHTALHLSVEAATGRVPEEALERAGAQGGSRGRAGSDLCGAR